MRDIKELLKEPELPQLDLTDFVAYVNLHPSYKIGILKKKIEGLVGYEKGDMILFEPYTIEQGYMRLSFDELQKSIKHCTICIPTPKSFPIRLRGGTIKCIVYVPLDHIDYEIKIQ